MLIYLFVQYKYNVTFYLGHYPQQKISAIVGRFNNSYQYQVFHS